MKILAKMARTYVYLLDEYDNITLESLHPEFDEVAKNVLAKLCDVDDFQVKEKDLSTLIMSILYRLFQENSVFKDKELTQTSFLKWGHTSKSTMEKWSNQMTAWGLKGDTFIVKRTQFQLPIMDFNGYMERLKIEIDHYDANYEAIELLREMMDMPSSQESPLLDQTTLMAVLEKYPETEAGYSGVMLEVEELIGEHQKRLQEQIALVNTDSKFDIWYHWPARAYLRLLFDLVDFHKAIGYFELAYEYGEMLLTLLKNDQLGVRELLIPTVIQLKNKEKTQQILDQFNEDDSSAMCYNRALFQIQIKSTKSDLAIKKALASNPHIPDYLFGLRTMPYEGETLPDRFSPGDETEAILYCYNALDAWHSVPRALSELKKIRKQQMQETKIVAFRPRR